MFETGGGKLYVWFNERRQPGKGIVFDVLPSTNEEPCAQQDLRRGQARKLGPVGQRQRCARADGADQRKLEPERPPDEDIGNALALVV